MRLVAELGVSWPISPGAISPAIPSTEMVSDTAASSELARLALRLCGASVLLRVLDRVDGRERPPAALMLARLITSCDPSDSIVGIR